MEFVTDLLKEAESWVGVGLILFFGLVTYLKVPGAAGKALDDRAAKIQAALDEAQALRDEATQLLNALRQQRAETERQAAEMIAAACERLIEPILYFKGFHALQAHRLAHAMLHAGRRDFAMMLQSRSSSVFGVDINPAAVIGKGVFLDHATSLVVGETCVIEDNVSILQGVTLGGTGKETGDRHPKIRHGVLIGAGAKILGNIEIGHCARVAAGSVVLSPVPHNKTVAGVPARIVGEAGCAEPARDMNQILAEKSVEP